MPPYEPTRPARRTSLNPAPGPSRGPSLPLVALGAGALLGLILGLVIGWGLFPVKWTDAWPSDLSDEARAQYLAAVSEAYVYYGDQQAAEIARNRLYGLNENLAEEIVAAQQFFTDHPQPNANLYIGNLGKLAQGLNAVSPDTVVETAPAAESAAAEGAPADAAAGSRVRSWVNSLLLGVAALALVIGGFVVITRMSRRRAAASTDSLDDEPEGFDDEDEFASRSGRNPFQRPMPSPMPTSVRDAGRARERGVMPSDAPHGEDYGFDEEHDESPAAFATGAAVDQLEDRDDFYDGPMLDMDDDELADTLGDDLADEELADDLAEDDLDMIEPEPSATLPRSGEALFDEDFDEDDEEDLAPGGYVQTAARTGRGTIVKTFTVHYQTGIPDYDQSYSIMDPAGGRYIGECGMGVHLKNGILQNNPDNVIALDVWLVDKQQERSYSSQSRVLLSEYVIDNNLETAFTRERPNDAAPLVPQAGMTFQLEGLSLVLDCTVLEARYIANGPTAGVFQSVKLDMTVRALD